MLPDKIRVKIENQIKIEMEAAQLYHGMSVWSLNNGLPDASHFYDNQCDEEVSHMNIVYDYLISAGHSYEKPKLDNTRNQHDEYESLLDTFNKSLNHEKSVSDSVNQLKALTAEYHDTSMVGMIHELIEEQAQDEDMFDMIIDDTIWIGPENVDIIQDMLTSMR